ncbi:MAG: type I secretion protein ATPase, partial [Paracoccus sp. (in: a-proteobacteria)]|nr:type I secretion protein ATPase [Paracoccus sp. (in: a-proteobacteria)]
EGDFITANIIQQHNFLNDSDQVALLDPAAPTGGAEIRLVTGSNAQLNAAQIQMTGIDSDILVGGSMYSDALIYQARLLDEDAAPTGVRVMPLASEAVVFLAEDMINPQSDHGDASLAAPVTHDPASGDLLHALIA